MLLHHSSWPCDTGDNSCHVPAVLIHLEVSETKCWVRECVNDGRDGGSSPSPVLQWLLRRWLFLLLFVKLPHHPFTILTVFCCWVEYIRWGGDADGSGSVTWIRCSRNHFYLIWKVPQTNTEQCDTSQLPQYWFFVIVTIHNQYPIVVVAMRATVAMYLNVNIMMMNIDVFPTTSHISLQPVSRRVSMLPV